MARHYDKQIDAAKHAVEETSKRRAERLSRDQIESFIKGFGLSATSTRLIVKTWGADAELAYDAGYQAGSEDASDY